MSLEASVLAVERGNTQGQTVAVEGTFGRVAFKLQCSVDSAHSIVRGTVDDAIIHLTPLTSPTRWMKLRYPQDPIRRAPPSSLFSVRQHTCMSTDRHGPRGWVLTIVATLGAVSFAGCSSRPAGVDVIRLPTGGPAPVSSYTELIAPGAPTEVPPGMHPAGGYQHIFPSARRATTELAVSFERPPTASHSEDTGLAVSYRDSDGSVHTMTVPLDITLCSDAETSCVSHG